MHQVKARQLREEANSLQRAEFVHAQQAQGRPMEIYFAEEARRPNLRPPRAARKVLFVLLFNCALWRVVRRVHFLPQMRQRSASLIERLTVGGEMPPRHTHAVLKKFNGDRKTSGKKGTTFKYPGTCGISLPPPPG